MNVTFPALPCSVFSLDTLDVSGNHGDDLMRQAARRAEHRSDTALHVAPCGLSLRAHPLHVYILYTLYFILGLSLRAHPLPKQALTAAV